MFGFGDKETADVARRLFEKSQEIAARFLGLSHKEAAALARVDFPESDRHISDREFSFQYADLPEFGFVVSEISGPVITAHGSGRFAGFMLQTGADEHSWLTSVYKPIGRAQGPKAQSLANVFEKQLGVRNMEKMMARIR